MAGAGGGGAGADGGTPDAADDAPSAGGDSGGGGSAGGGAVGAGEEGIFATINGEQKAFTVDLSAFGDSMNLHLGARIAQTTETLGIDLYGPTGFSPGAYFGCPTDQAVFTYSNGQGDAGSSMYGARSTHGACMVTITKMALVKNDFYEGFFTAMLAPDGGGAVAYIVTNGTFRLRR